MVNFVFVLLALTASYPSAIAQSTNRVGYTGVLSSLDGGLGGTVQVVDTMTLEITGYTLKDASAPALYWWGTTDGTIQDGFRISSKQVTQAATSDMLTIKLDEGKTSADFSTVGLWCERLSANFGQATLMPSGGSANSTSSGGSTSTGSTPAAATTTVKSAGTTLFGSGRSLIATLVAAASFAAWMG